MFSQEELKKIEEISSMEGEQQAIALQSFLKTLKPEQIEYLKGQQKCVFCSIANKQIASIVVYEDNDNIAVMDINPASLGHVIVIPKRHMQFYWESNNSIDSLVKMLSLAIVNATKATGINVMIANGTAAGQIASHLAVHLIPRYKDDDIVMKWVGKKIASEELSEVAKKIVGSLDIRKEKIADKIVEKKGYTFDEFLLEERIP